MSLNTPDTNNNENKKKWFSFSNISTFVMLAFIVAMVVNPNVKAFVIQNLMKVGLFQPSVPSEREIGEEPGSSFKAPGEIAFKDSDGQVISLSDLRGKVVFLNFWATWCPPCIAEMPSINKLKERYKNKEVSFLMIDADANYQKSIGFMNKHGYDLPVFISVNQIPENIFGDSLPTTVILDREGNMVFKHEGSADYESPKMIAFIDRLLVK